MPGSFPFRLAAVGVLTMIITISGAAAASAGTVAANLRVVTTSGKVLADQTQYTDTVKLKSDPKADCFGAGSQGSGKTTTIDGPTALGMVVDGAGVNPALRPVSVTDAFSFGLGVCGFGGQGPKDKNGFWALRVNHRDAAVGGDSIKVKPGDDILWYLAAKYPAPDELVLQAPPFVKARTPFTVQVWSYDAKGKRKPAKGATVPGADLPTGADGKTTVMVDDVTALTARAAGLIPSNSATVCITGIGTKYCTHSPIDGSGRADTIKGTSRTDDVRAGAGDDTVNVRGGGFDRVNCGAGKDTAVLDKSDKAVGCEVRKVS